MQHGATVLSNIYMKCEELHKIIKSIKDLPRLTPTTTLCRTNLRILLPADSNHDTKNYIQKLKCNLEINTIEHISRTLRNSEQKN